MNTYRSILAPELAKVIRAFLALEIPATKFSVRVRRGSSTIDITWVDGPSRGYVGDLLAPLEGRHFDGMTDSGRVRPSPAAYLAGNADSCPSPIFDGATGRPSTAHHWGWQALIRRAAEDRREVAL